MSENIKYFKSRTTQTFIKVMGERSVEVYLNEATKESTTAFEGTMGDAFYNTEDYEPCQPSEFHNAYHSHQENILDFVSEGKRISY